MKAKLFISHHPGGLLFYRNLIKIIKRYDKNVKFILFKVNHPYFEKFDLKPYKEYFDEIVDFEFVNYKKNFIKEWGKIFNFQKKLKKAINDFLVSFEQIDIFMDDSAWLPINILLYNLSQQKNIKSINRFFLAEPESSQTKTDRIKSVLTNLYCLPFKCYKVRMITTLAGKFMDFRYTDNVPGTIKKIASPFTSIEGENIFSYPVILNNTTKHKKDMVIVFAGANVFKTYREYLPRERIFLKKITEFFSALENRYAGCKLCYKPHPSDRGKIMPGVDIKKYSLFGNDLSAQVLLDKYQSQIKAVYTLLSTSAVQSSFFGVPSYTFYRYLFNEPGIKKLDNLFEQDNIGSQYIFSISDLNEIGKIDNIKRPDFSKFKKLERAYRKILCF